MKRRNLKYEKIEIILRTFLVLRNCLMLQLLHHTKREMNITRHTLYIL